MFVCRLLFLDFSLYFIIIFIIIFRKERYRSEKVGKDVQNDTIKGDNKEKVATMGGPKLFIRSSV